MGVVERVRPAMEPWRGRSHAELDDMGDTPVTVAVADALSALYRRVRPSVVLLYRTGSNGAGTIWSDDGLIVTNDHVVSGTGSINVVLADGRTYLGIVAARHPTRDLALVKIAAEGVPAIASRDSTTLRVGELAATIGHPMGYRDAMSIGVVASAPEAGARAGREDVIQTDVRFAPGNSGGPLIDHAGRAIGICTRVAGQLGLAIPSAAVIAFVDASSAADTSSTAAAAGEMVGLHTGSPCMA